MSADMKADEGCIAVLYRFYMCICIVGSHTGVIICLRDGMVWYGMVWK